MTALTTKDDITFSLPAAAADKINAAAVAKVNAYLPELEQKTRAFDRNNSQHTLSLMTLTMLNGQSPYRMMRQVMAEVEKRKMALAEAQVSHAKTIKEIQDLEGSIDSVEQAELMYRNLLDGGRAQTATIEYLQQYGVHPQVAMTEVSGYVQHTAQRIASGNLMHSNDLEDFLDQMADKYRANVDKTSERLFGKTDFINPEYMLRLEAKT